MKEKVDQVVQALRAKYPYQFERTQFGAHLTVGWLSRFVQLCEEVDQALGEDKRGFHWDGVDEKFGVIQFGYGFHARKDVVIAGRELLDPLMARARLDLKGCCVVCGRAGGIEPSRRYMLTLCQEHRSIKDGDFWVIVDTGSVYEAAAAWQAEKEKQEAKQRKESA